MQLLIIRGHIVFELIYVAPSARAGRLRLFLLKFVWLTLRKY
jgi:hypothetical protein